MPAIRPPRALRRLFGPVTRFLAIGGTRTLRVTDRHTGRQIPVAVIPVIVNGRTYVVAARGVTEWARNLRADPHCSLGRRKRELAHRASEVPVADRQPIIDIYRVTAGRAVRSFFLQAPDPKDHPVFELVRVANPRPERRGLSR